MSKKNIETMYPLSPVQQGMLYETVSAPRSGIHIEQMVMTLKDELDIATFVRSWQWEMNRHEILRTCFIWETQVEPLQVVLREVELPFFYHDWRSLSSDQQRIQLETYLADDQRAGFKLSRAPLMRLTIFHSAEATYHVLWTFHHILMDGWCCFLIMKELLSYYQALSKGQELYLERPRPYREYIAWLLKQDISQAEQFWRESLRGFTQATPLGKEDGVVSQDQQREQYGTKECSLSASTTATLQSLARQHHLTLNTLLQGTWALLLSSYSGRDDVLFGITVAGRPADLPGSETMLGLCINTLPLRITLQPAALLWSWFESIQKYTFQLRLFEFSPVDLVYRCSEMHGTQLLYESLLVVENYPLDLSIIQRLGLNFSVSEIRSEGAHTKYALTLMIIPNAELKVVCVYDTRRLTDEAIAQILEHFQMLLEKITTASADLLASELRESIPKHQIPLLRPLPNHPAQQKAGLSTNMPRNHVEDILAEICADVLGQEKMGIHDNFFEAGGHSLLATQLISRLRTVLQVELPLRTLFEAPTVAELAERVNQALRKGLGGELPPLIPIPRDRDLPLSFAQQRLWFLDQWIDPQEAHQQRDSSSFNLPNAVRMQGTLIVEALDRGLKEIERRHESLRTTFHIKGDVPVQVIAPEGTFQLDFIDMRGLTIEDRNKALQSTARMEAERPFVLSQGPLLRAVLVRLCEHEHVLLMTFHHIISDAWSMGVLVHEIQTLYTAFIAGKPSPLPDLSIQYADFAYWQRQYLQGDVLKLHLDYWTSQLHDVTLLKLPTDRPQLNETSFAGTVVAFSLPVDLSEALLRLSREQGVTLFITLLAAFQVLLYRYTGQEDILVGTDIASRTRTELELLIGFFVNLLVLRTDFRGEPQFCEVLRRVRESVLGAYAHQELPFEKIVEVLKLERTSQVNQTSLINALFVLQNTPVPATVVPDLTISMMDIEVSTTRFTLGVFMWEDAGGLAGYVSYSSDLFDRSTIGKMIAHFEVLLRNIVLQPEASIDALEIYTEQEKEEQLLKEQARLALHRRKLRDVRLNEARIFE